MSFGTQNDEADDEERENQRIEQPLSQSRDARGESMESMASVDSVDLAREWDSPALGAAGGDDEDGPGEELEMISMAP